MPAALRINWVRARRQVYRRDYYGVHELAVLLGVTKQVIDNWRTRGRHELPKPDIKVHAGPIWLWRTLSDWLATKDD